MSIYISDLISTNEKNIDEYYNNTNAVVFVMGKNATEDYYATLFISIIDTSVTNVMLFKLYTMFFIFALATSCFLLFVPKRNNKKLIVKDSPIEIKTSNF